MSQIKCFELHPSLRRLQSPLYDSNSKSKSMARIVARALPFSGRTLLPPPPISAALRWFSSSSRHGLPSSPSDYPALLLPTLSQPSISWRSIHVSPGCSHQHPFAGYLMASVRGLRKLRRRNGATKKRSPPPKNREIELCVRIGLHDDLPKDLEVLVQLLCNIFFIYTNFVSLFCANVKCVKSLQSVWK
jgi:hypothetical protein